MIQPFAQELRPLRRGIIKPAIYKVTATVCLTASLTGSFTMHAGQIYPTVAFAAPSGYQEVYRRLDSAARECKPAAKKQGAIVTENQSADYHFVIGMANEEPMKVAVQSTGPSSSDVTITYVNVMGWNEGMANSLKQSILPGKPTC